LTQCLASHILKVWKNEGGGHKVSVVNDILIFQC
jgi:hypothetical protein